MAEAPLIERFDCGKLIVIEDSDHETKSDRVKTNGTSEIRRHSSEGDHSSSLSNHLSEESQKQNKMEFAECITNGGECNGNNVTIGTKEGIKSSDDKEEHNIKDSAVHTEDSIKVDDNENPNHDSKNIISNPSKNLINYHRKNGAQLVQCSGCYDNML
eukprot:TRINITY_DN37889_c0_g1_i1.p2 TRINITY_DN37889_c0_g1~~TRINITY_DN37889_c0_g1_i1.p2  ORF type:complete len:158 (+),score=35.23 TRINITY_DN37889_c0_g1_i1:1031-1504(+)